MADLTRDDIVGELKKHKGKGKGEKQAKLKAFLSSKLGDKKCPSEALGGDRLVADRILDDLDSYEDLDG